MGTSIYDAAVAGDLEQVQAIVDRNPEAVNEMDEYGFTALHGLAGEEHYVIVFKKFAFLANFADNF